MAKKKNTAKPVYAAPEAVKAARKWKNPSSLTADIYRTAYSTAELQQMRRSLAKSANQRMVRLERAESTITGKSFAYGAYDIAQKYLKDAGQGKRFKENVKHLGEDRSALQREILELQRFLGSKSSIASEQKKSEKKRVATFKNKGLSEKTVASKEFYNFLNSQAFERAVKKAPTSDDIVDAYNEAREAGKSDDEINQIINNWESTPATGVKELRTKLGLRPVVNSANK